MSPAADHPDELLALIREQLRTVVLATISASGEPEASVAAAVSGEAGTLVICVSGLAAHTANLRANPRASVLLAEDEAAAPQPLARRRLTFACSAAPVPRDGVEFAPLIAQFRARFGATIDVLASLPDFQLFRLTPTRGRLVVGFGQAFAVDPRNWAVLSRVTR